MGAGTACAMTNDNTQAGLSSWGTAHSSLGALQPWKCSGSALEMSVFAGIKFPCVEPRALFWFLCTGFFVLSSVLYSGFCSLFRVLSSLLWLSSSVVLLSCSLLARGSPEQPWNSFWSREVLPGLLGFPSWDSSASVMLFSLSGISWVVFSSSFQQAGLGFQAKPGSALQDLRIQAKHSGMQNSWSWEQGGRDVPQMCPRCGALSLLPPGLSWVSPSARSKTKEAPLSHQKNPLSWPFPLNFASSHGPGSFPCPENLEFREFKLSGGDLS